MLKFTRLDPRSGDLIEQNACLMSFGLTELAIPAIAGLLTSAGVGAGTAASIAGVAAPTLINAGLGAAGSAVMGGNPGQGALFGGLAGGLGPLSKAVGFGSAPGALQVPAAVGPTQSQMDDGTMVTNPAPSGSASMTGPAQGVAAAAPQSPLAAFASKVGGSSGGGLSGPLALLAALAQNANRPSTTAPGAATANQPWNPTGYLNRTPTPNYAPAPGSSYYTYGNSAQPQFFSGNQLNLTPHMSHGGALSREMSGGRYAHGGALSQGNEFSTGGGQNYVQGAGNGQSDEIPAKLSDGEFVMDAGSVSRLGAGSSEAGARGMDAIRRAIDDDTKSDGVVMRKPQSPLHYAEIGKRAARAA